MSQRMNTAPTPQDAATALASTQAIHPELANRKDIPLTAFDFLDGAYAATKRARAIGLGVLGVSLLVLAWTVLGGLRTTWETRDVDREVAALKDSRGTLVGEFGESVEGIPTESLLDRERVLSAGFAGVTNQQGNFLALFDELRLLDSGQARVSSVSYGLVAAEEGAATEEGDAAAGSARVAVRILITGSDLSATVTLADRIRQIPGLEGTRIDLGGTGASISGFINLNKPPQRLLDRLATLGVRPDAASRATTEADATDGAATDAGTDEEPVTDAPVTDTDADTGEGS